MAVENTTCVQPEDYEEPGFTAETVVVVASVVSAIFTGGASLLVVGVAGLSVLRKVLEYLLYGKLVCLGGDRCAIGFVAQVEPVGFQKPFFDAVDDDYSMNLVLAGRSSLLDFVRDSSDPDKAKLANLAAARRGPQGDLLVERPNMPEPREAKKDVFGNYEGYYTWFEGPSYGTRFIQGEKDVHVPVNGLKSEWGPFPVPVLHAECEGNRSAALLDALNNVPPGVGGICKVPIIGRIACALVSFLFLPFVAAALLIAWFASSHGNPADAGAGTIAVGELLVVNGRWVFDAGHTGYNEIHPVRTLQKIPPDTIRGNFEAWHNEWCRLATEPPPPAPPGTKPVRMTPVQEAIWERQQEPENIWELHPDVDGCRPHRQPEPEHGQRTPIK